MLKNSLGKRIISAFVLLLLTLNFINIAAWMRTNFLNSKVQSSYSSAIDWKKLYPFRNEPQPSADPASAPAGQTGSLTKWRAKASEISGREDNLEKNCTSQVFAFHPLVELNGFVTMKFGKVIFPNEDVFLLKNGYWAFTKDKTSSEETKQTADHIAGLSQYCSEAGIRFLYVQPPAKVSKYDPEIPDGAENYENQNYDALLGELQKLGIPALDLRAQIDAENLDHYSLFYRTDHHWKVESALWACGEIAERLNTIYSCGLDVTKTDKNLYRTKIYRDWFLGSAGRRVSLGCAKPEDFSILLPNFKTALNIRVPNAEINKTGKFEDVIYNKQVLETKDYYNLSCYESQLYGNQPLTQIKNEENPGGPKILVLGDSFSLAMVPYLSLTAGETDLIDFRQDQGNFSGSIQTYIDQMKPDVVLLAYEPGASYSLK
ncbi:MAG: DHHW family protein [Oscillospiraceae bacterium]|jgi:hypothetical protein|nr:DHHW family protein [Oscillospiraceae bacterium]MCI1990962.1 DHHW family protein [Oscillospiraceae bacterium]